MSLAKALHLDCLSVCLFVRRGTLLPQSCFDYFLLVADPIWLPTPTRSDLCWHCVHGLRMYSDNPDLHLYVQTVFGQLVRLPVSRRTLGSAFAINWSLNWSTDLLCSVPCIVSPLTFTESRAVFILPFFIVTCLKLRKRQKVALCGVFSLGLITIVISLARFLVYTVSDYSLDDASGSKRIAENWHIPPVTYRRGHRGRRD